MLLRVCCAFAIRVCYPRLPHAFAIRVCHTRLLYAFATRRAVLSAYGAVCGTAQAKELATGIDLRTPKRERRAAGTNLPRNPTQLVLIYSEITRIRYSEITRARYESAVKFREKTLSLIRFRYLSTQISAIVVGRMGCAGLREGVGANRRRKAGGGEGGRGGTASLRHVRPWSGTDIGCGPYEMSGTDIGFGLVLTQAVVQYCDRVSVCSAEIGHRL
eukprot:2554245-Rhodomonas_salina.1